MGKVPFESSTGDLGTKAAEDSLKGTPAGKKPTIADAFGATHMPDMGKAMGYMSKNDCRGKGMGGDCM